MPWLRCRHFLLVLIAQIRIKLLSLYGAPNDHYHRSPIYCIVPLYHCPLSTSCVLLSWRLFLTPRKATPKIKQRHRKEHFKITLCTLKFGSVGSKQPPATQQHRTTSTMGGDSFSSGTFNDPKHVVSGSGLERTIYSSVSIPIFRLRLHLFHVQHQIALFSSKHLTNKYIYSQ